MAVALISSCSDKKESEPQTTGAQAKTSLASDTSFGISGAITPGKERIEEKNKSDWTYSGSIDEMNGGVIKYASVKSSNHFVFQSPYGYNKMTITIREWDGKQEVYLKIDDGQFSSKYQQSTVKVRFDDEKPRKYTFNETTSNDSKIIFLNNKLDFIKRCKSADSIKTESSFFREGTLLFKFDSKNLKWDA